MKNLLLAFMVCFICVPLISQTTAPTTLPQPKIRYHTGFFNVKWELGDKDAKPTDIQLHLDKTDPDAANNFRKAKSLETQSTIFSIISSGALLVGLFTKDTPSIVGYGGAVFFGVASLGTAISSGNKYEKAVDGYNRKFGY